jgi:hypothetical protein
VKKCGRKRRNAAAEEGDAKEQETREPLGKVARSSETIIDPTLETGKAPVVPRIW